MACDKDKIAQELIDWHFSVDPSIVVVYRIFSPTEDADDEPIKLLEVSEDTLETGRVDAFAFGPTEDIGCSTVTACVSGKEIPRIENGEIALPEGWDLSKSKIFVRLAYNNVIK